MNEDITPKRRTRQHTLREETLSSPRKISWSVITLSLMLIAALGVAGYFYYQLKWSQKVETGEEIKDITTTIGQFIELPSDETPTLATVTDREKLADQTFFLKAENGDKVLIYSNSGKAILYRPNTKKVIDMTTVNVAKTEALAPNTPSPEVPQETVPEKQATTAVIYNGSTKVGATLAIEEQIGKAFEGLTVVEKESAQKKDYQGIIVVDIKGEYKADAEKLASLLGATVANLPEGETAPEADLLVIVGNTTAPETE